MTICVNKIGDELFTAKKIWRPIVSRHISLCVGRLLDAHLLDKPLSATNLVHYEQDVADVADDVAAEGLVELDVRHCREPSAVEVNTDKLALAVENGRA